MPDFVKCKIERGAFSDEVLFTLKKKGVNTGNIDIRYARDHNRGPIHKEGLDCRRVGYIQCRVLESDNELALIETPDRQRFIVNVYDIIKGEY
jgi:hypothetical protein